MDRVQRISGVNSKSPNDRDLDQPNGKMFLDGVFSII